MINTEKNISQSPVILKITAAALFMVMLFVPVIQMKFHIIKERQINEKRELAPFPKLKKITGGALKSYLIDYEKFFNDHYGFRSALIRMRSCIYYNIFQTSPSTDVIIGKNKWLFYNSPLDGTSIPDFYGKVPYNTTQLKSMGGYLRNLQNEFDKRGIKFIVLIAPSKHTVYPEYLPEYIEKSRGKSTRADQLDVLMKENKINFIDLRRALIDAKQKYPYNLYYTTDTHWNRLGGFAAYTGMTADLVSLFPAIKPKRITDYKIVDTEILSQGDLTILSELNADFKDHELSLNSIKPVKADVVSSKGYEEKTITTQIKGSILPKLIVFRDSFFAFTIPFISENFSKAIYIWQHNIDFSIIDKEKPDLVILEFTERYSDQALLKYADSKVKDN